MTCTMEEVKIRDLKEEDAEILVDLFKKAYREYHAQNYNNIKLN